MNDDEMAEAAVLLAHTPPDEPMSAELEQRILEASAAARASTTKASVLELPPVAAVQPSPSPWRDLAPWLAAAACIAFLVFRWRTSTLEQADAERAMASPGTKVTLALVAADGVEHGGVVWARDLLRGELMADESMPGAGELAVWARAADGGAVSLGPCPAPRGRVRCSVSSAGALRVPEEIWVNGRVTAGPGGATVDADTPPPLLTTRPTPPVER